MQRNAGKIRSIFIVYWILLLYVVAALIWWYVALSQQNRQMTVLKIKEVSLTDSHYKEKLSAIQEANKRKTAQYIGEGSIFLLLILAGAIFLFRAVKKQLELTSQQRNFMMAVTHELKTPLAVTRLNLETLQKRKIEETQRERLINNTLQIGRAHV